MLNENKRTHKKSSCGLVGGQPETAAESKGRALTADTYAGDRICLIQRGYMSIVPLKKLSDGFLKGRCDRFRQIEGCVISEWELPNAEC